MIRTYYDFSLAICAHLNITVKKISISCEMCACFFYILQWIFVEEFISNKIYVYSYLYVDCVFHFIYLRKKKKNDWYCIRASMCVYICFFCWVIQWNFCYSTKCQNVFSFKHVRLSRFHSPKSYDHCDVLRFIYKWNCLHSQS